MKKIKNRFLIFLGIWWLLVAIVMLIEESNITQKFQGFFIFFLLASIHFLLAKNYIIFYFSKEARALRNKIRKKEMEEFKNELLQENKNSYKLVDLYKCPECGAIIDESKYFLYQLWKKIKGKQFRY